MTPTEVRDLAGGLFEQRRRQSTTRNSVNPGDHIVTWRPAGDGELEVEFDDGTAAYIAIRIYNPQPGDVS